MECVICCDDVSLENDKGLQMHCRHVFHESCIREWLSYTRECPLCRIFFALGRDVPIRIEDTNKPSSTLLEVHKQLWFLQEHFAKNNQSKMLDFLLECMQRRHRTEVVVEQGN